MQILLEVLKEVSATTLIAFLWCGFTIIGSIVAATIKVYNMAQKWRHAENEKEAKENELKQSAQNIQILESKVDKLNESFSAYLVNDRKDKQALLRDSIQTIYNETLKKRYIINEDKKNYDHLYDRYISNEGNSYIVETVNPYISNLPIFLTHEEAKRYYEEHGTYK